MLNPFLFVDKKLLDFATDGKFFYLSVWLFITQFLFGCLYLLWLSTFENLKKKSVKGIFYFYQICFYFDLWFCFSDCFYGGKILTSFSVSFLFALVKFVLLIALYGLICAHKGILNLREKDKLKKESKLKSEQNKSLKDNNYGGQINEENPFSNWVNKPIDSEKIADVNVGYIKSVIERLKQKNITEEERENLSSLEYLIRFPIVLKEENVKKLNVKLEYLLNKMAKYNLMQ